MGSVLGIRLTAGPVKSRKLLQPAASVARRLELRAAWEQASAACYSEEAAAPPDTGSGDVAGGSGPLTTTGRGNADP